MGCLSSTKTKLGALKDSITHHPAFVIGSALWMYTDIILDIFSVVVKLREREGQGVDPGRSLKSHLWMVDGGWWISFP